MGLRVETPGQISDYFRSFYADSVRALAVRELSPNDGWDSTFGPASVAVGGCYGSTVGEDGQCYCSKGYDWSSSRNQCQSSKDLYHDANFCPAKFGGPIVPLTGAKSISLDLGILIGKERLVLNYDTARQVPGAAGLPTVNGTSKFRPEPMASFGQFWESSLHKTVAIQRNAGTYIQAMSASRGDGRWVSFRNTSTFDFTADPSVRDTLARPPLVYGVGVPNQVWYKDTQGNQEVYEIGPATDETSYLKSVAYASGGGLTYTYSDANTPIATAPVAGLLISIQDHQGRIVQFKYAQPADLTQRPRITQVTDPNGRTTAFAYNTNGGLTGVTWPDAKVRQYLYERSDLKFAVTGVVDEKNARVSTFTYDTAGRATGTQAAGGVNSYSVTYGTPPSWNVVETWDATNSVLWRDHYRLPPQGMVLTMPNGQTSSIPVADVGGTPFISSQSQPAGSGCAASAKATSYNVAGSKTSEDGFDGVRTCYAYDGTSRNLEVTQVQGLASATACSAVTAANASLPAGSRKLSTKWHPVWRKPVAAAAPGTLTTTVYNGQPDPYNGNAAASCVTGNPALPDGTVLPVVCKTVVQGTRDANGSVAFAPAITAVDPSFANVSLLLLADTSDGLSFVDASNYAHVHAAPSSAVAHDLGVFKFGDGSAKFDAAGKFLKYTPAAEFNFGSGDFTVETWAYFTTSGDRAMYYGDADASGGNWQIALERTAANLNAASVVDVNGVAYAITGSAIAANTWIHIALVRSGTSLKLYRNGVLDGSAALPAGVALRVPLGSPTVGRNGDVGTFYGGEYGSYMIGNLDEFRITKGVARYLSNFTVPGTSSVLDTSVSKRTSIYTYDAAGRVLTQTDPRGSTTTNAYYATTSFTGTAPNEVGVSMGDLQTSTNPRGHVTTYNQYDRSGRLLRMTDPNGAVTVFTYTARGFVNTASVTPAGGTARVTTYAYDGNGQQTQVTMPDGAALLYTYDAAHRLTSIADAVGNKATYTLDNMGNRTAEDLKDPLGVLARSISRSFDALNRVQSVTGEPR
jgi:YD repeat-containing protein